MGLRTPPLPPPDEPVGPPIRETYESGAHVWEPGEGSVCGCRRCEAGLPPSIPSLLGRLVVIYWRRWRVR